MSSLVERLPGDRLGPQHKAIPASAWGLTIEEFLASEPRLAALETPVLTLDQSRMDHNLAAMARWVAERGMLLAPHGKTTMAPQLWNRQLDAGSWAITLATPWQVQLARKFGINRILLANPIIGPGYLRWLTGELRAHPEFDFYSWADSVDTVEQMNAHLDDPSAPPINVLVELGAPAGRTGARSVEEAVRVAEAVRASPYLALAGVAGYEGALGHDRSEAAVHRVNAYLDEMAALAERVASMIDVPPVVTAGGSAYPDLVADRLAGQAAAGASVVLRSGAYITHDDGFYKHISPFSDDVDPANSVHLQSAMHGWARVISAPESGLVLLDSGKRDFPYDEGLPVVQDVGPATVTAMNDQHTFVRDNAELRVGDVVRLGLSHPCTAFDKWRLIPVISDHTAADPVVVDLIHTYF